MKNFVTMLAVVAALSVAGTSAFACPHHDKEAKKACTEKGLKAKSPEFKACLKEAQAACSDKEKHGG
jgi:hypothetical protein